MLPSKDSTHTPAFGKGDSFYHLAQMKYYLESAWKEFEEFERSFALFEKHKHEYQEIMEAANQQDDYWDIELTNMQTI